MKDLSLSAFKKLLLVVLVVSAFVLFYQRELRLTYVKSQLDQKRDKLKSHMNLAQCDRGIMLIGNSLTFDPCFRSDLSGCKVGMPGEMLYGIEQWLKDDSTLLADTLIIWMGLNDVLNGVDHADISRQYTRIVQRLVKPNRHIVLVGLPSIDLPEDGWFVKNEESNIRIAQLNTFIETFAQRSHCRFVDISPIMEGIESNIIHTPDGVHLTCFFYERLTVKISQLFGIK